jgi:hypothetical protein
MTCKKDGLPKVCPNAKCRAINAWTLVQYGRFSGPLTISGCHPCHVDGWSEIQCRHCGIRIGGWTGRILKGGEHEPPYGGEHNAGCAFGPKLAQVIPIVKG